MYTVSYEYLDTFRKVAVMIKVKLLPSFLKGLKEERIIASLIEESYNDYWQVLKSATTANANFDEFSYIVVFIVNHLGE